MQVAGHIVLEKSIASRFHTFSHEMTTPQLRGQDTAELYYKLVTEAHGQKYKHCI